MKSRSPKIDAWMVVGLVAIILLVGMSIYQLSRLGHRRSKLRQSHAQSFLPKDRSLDDVKNRQSDEESIQGSDDVKLQSSDHGISNHPRRLKLKEYKCPDVRNGMMKGRWRQREPTFKEKVEVDEFIEGVRDLLNITRNLERDDGRCGDVQLTYETSVRALCDPEGPTPCCQKGRCVTKNEGLCDCPDCVDLRSFVHPEYSTWEPADSRCEVQNYTVRSACNVIGGSELYVVGDSIMRHMYTALLLLMSGNPVDGAVYNETVGNYTEETCSRQSIFSEPECQSYIREEASFCSANPAKVTFREVNVIEEGQVLFDVIRHLLDKKRSYIVIGLGLQDDFDVSVLSSVVEPAIKLLASKKSDWPKLIWASTHSPYPLMFPAIFGENFEYVRKFNSFMEDNLRQYHIPIFDTLNVTSGVVSPDGVHYGMGLNMMKAQMFLNFFKETYNKNDRNRYDFEFTKS